MKNPVWNESELILELDLYFRLTYGQMDGRNPKVKDLSQLLSLMNEKDGFRRSVNSISLKLANFKRIDPNFTGSGMKRGGQLEEVIWKKYSEDRKELKNRAEQIKKQIIKSRKKEYINWLQNTGNSDGDNYEENIITKYADQLEQSASSDSEKVSIYEVTDIDGIFRLESVSNKEFDNSRKEIWYDALQNHKEFITDKYIHQDIFDIDDTENYTEGGKKVYISLKAERNPKLRKKAIRIHGTSCQVCGFNFGLFYGKWGEGFIEVHHLKPLGDNKKGEIITDPEKDLIVICANCHRMIHRKKGVTLTLEELKQKINPV